MVKVTADELLTKDLRGKVICFPTDTVYGVGALVDDFEAVERIFAMKHRALDKPLAILTGTKAIDDYVLEINQLAQELIATRWPGNLTLVFTKAPSLDPWMTRGQPTIAFRMPDCEVSLKILKHFGPMATTSINEAGQPPLNDYEAIKRQFGSAIDYFVCDEVVFSKHPSEVIDVTTSHPKIMRK